MKPTQAADNFFGQAFNNNNTPAAGMSQDFQSTIHFIILGLQAMNTGLRATYIKLEEIERLMKARH